MSSSTTNSFVLVIAFIVLYMIIQVATYGDYYTGVYLVPDYTTLHFKIENKINIVPHMCSTFTHTQCCVYCTVHNFTDSINNTNCASWSKLVVYTNCLCKFRTNI